MSLGTFSRSKPTFSRVSIVVVVVGEEVDVDVVAAGNEVDVDEVNGEETSVLVGDISSMASDSETPLPHPLAVINRARSTPTRREITFQR
jgi:hypothetical protein